MSDQPRERNSFDDFCTRMHELQKEACSYGIASLCVLNDSDPIGREDTTTVLYQGGKIVCLGLATFAEHGLLNRGREVDNPPD